MRSAPAFQVVIRPSGSSKKIAYSLMLPTSRRKRSSMAGSEAISAFPWEATSMRQSRAGRGARPGGDGTHSRRRDPPPGIVAGGGSRTASPDRGTPSVPVEHVGIQHGGALVRRAHVVVHRPEAELERLGPDL